MLEMVYGESAMKHRTVCKWVDRFKEGRESVDDEVHAGRPSTSRVDENVQRVYDLVKRDRRITPGMIAEKLGISKGNVHTILKEEILKEDLYMRKLCAKIVPEVLIDEQTQGRVDCCNDWIKSAQDPHFRERVITGDKAWIYDYDPETKRHSEEWKHPGSPRTKIACKSCSKIKTMLIFFFFFFSIFVELFIMNMFQQVKLLIQNSMLKS
jgi:ribosomal protein S25